MSGASQVWTGASFQIATYVIGALLVTVVTALAVMVGRKVVNAAKQLGQMHDDWVGDPARPGVAERPGVMLRLQSIEEHNARTDQVLTDIQHELHPNSGHSMRDVVNDLYEHSTGRPAPAQPPAPIPTPAEQ